jgi:REP element-mobilizing transposase RayT
MANTYTQIYLQIVFGIRGKGNSLPVKEKHRLHGYIAEIVANRSSKLLIANSMHDHIHLLVGCKPSISVSDLVRDIKSNSSLMMKESNLVLPSFKWQDGYGAFSYGRSQLPEVIAYIENQEEHHRVRTFREEYIQFLELFGIEYDPEWVFDKDQL